MKFFDKAKQWVKDHPVLTGLGVVAVAAGGYYGYKYIRGYNAGFADGVSDATETLQKLADAANVPDTPDLPKLSKGSVADFWPDTCPNGDKVANIIVNDLSLGDLGSFGEDLIANSGVSGLSSANEVSVWCKMFDRLVPDAGTVAETAETLAENAAL